MIRSSSMPEHGPPPQNRYQVRLIPIHRPLWRNRCHREEFRRRRDDEAIPSPTRCPPTSLGHETCFVAPLLAVTSIALRQMANWYELPKEVGWSARDSVYQLCRTWRAPVLQEGEMTISGTDCSRRSSSAARIAFASVCMLKGFCRNLTWPVSIPAPQRFVLGVPGHEDDREFRPASLQTAGQVVPCDVGEHQVGEEQREPGLGREKPGLGAGPNRHSLVSERGQNLRAPRAHLLRLRPPAPAHRGRPPTRSVPPEGYPQARTCSARTEAERRGTSIPGPRAFPAPPGRHGG